MEYTVGAAEEVGAFVELGSIVGGAEGAILGPVGINVGARVSLTSHPHFPSALGICNKRLVVPTGFPLTVFSGVASHNKDALITSHPAAASIRKSYSETPFSICNATAPATCGVAIDVPEIVHHNCVPPFEQLAREEHADKIETPGAIISTNDP